MPDDADAGVMVSGAVTAPAAAARGDDGLSSAEAARQLAEFGPNAVAEQHVHPAVRMLHHFWSPVPWMLEATVALQVASGERLEATIVAALLMVNVALASFQENRADAALALLRQRLYLKTRVKRDGAWGERAAAELVPGDLVQLALGGVVPADIRLLSGSVLLDQSMLTGESIPAEMGPTGIAYAGALVRRGEAIGEVVATGTRTYFGRAAELVRIAHIESSEQRAVFGVVRNLTIVNFAIVVGMVAYAHTIAMTASQIIPLVLTALLAAVPVALPATFTLAATLGARTLALKGVLLTRLTALHEAAMTDVLCADKTGTLTENALAIAAVRPTTARYGEAEIVAFAALASSRDGGDPIDAAIRDAAGRHRQDPYLPTVQRFMPFDPARKTAEAVALDASGKELLIVKGAPAAIAALTPMTSEASAALEGFAAAGYRTIAVATGSHGRLQLIGLIAFSDPPRSDSRSLLAELRSLGVRTVMVSGDSAATAATVARGIGLDGPVCLADNIPENGGPEDYAVYAGVFPQDKFRLVKSFQQRGHAVAMCGDGANDAPALRQAQMGIAVSTATDVAKAAAGIVLTEPGLGGIVACIAEGRAGFQRILTYTLSLLVNKCATIIVLGFGLIMTGHAVLTPLLQATSMLASDFVTMARAADRATPSGHPNTWRIRNLTFAALPLGVFKVAYYIAVLAAGWFVLGFDPGHMQTLTFLMMVLGGQATVYVLRERGRIWHSCPAWPMLVASGSAVILLTIFALAGFSTPSLPPSIVASLFGITLVYALGLDAIKGLVLSHIRID